MKMYRLLSVLAVLAGALAFCEGRHQKPAKYCPSDNWTPCGLAGVDCIIPSTIFSTTISFGGVKKQKQRARRLLSERGDGRDEISVGLKKHNLPPNPGSNEGEWTFAAMTNQANQEFSIPCTPKNFGNMQNGGKKKNLGCCYMANPKESYATLHGPSLSKNNYVPLAKEGGQFTVGDGQPHQSGAQYVRFGMNGAYVYRWLKGTFDCTTDWFHTFTLQGPNASSVAGHRHGHHHGHHHGGGGTFSCEVAKGFEINKTKVAFYPCGDDAKRSGGCNTWISESNQGSTIALMAFGEAPNYAYRYVWSENQGFMPCNSKFFGDPNAKKNLQNYQGLHGHHHHKPGVEFCAVSNASVFSGVVGRWTKAVQCEGQPCVLDESINYGVTTTTTKSHTSSWTTSLTNTITVGFSFFGFSFSDSVSTEVAHTVSNTVSHAYTRSVSKDCDVRCGGGKEDTWTVWQWQFNLDQWVKADLSPFMIYACNFICTTSHKEPLCPPGYCADTDCQTCRPGFTPPKPHGNASVWYAGQGGRSVDEGAEESRLIMSALEALD